MIKFFDGLNWMEVKAAYIYHEGIGFVTMSSIRCFADGEWRVISAGNRELIGANA
jgi:hypothetical protein